jgi:Icc-related predicted phosphoesterase
MRTALNIAAIGDLHCTRSSQAAVHALFGQLAQLPITPDVLLLLGDLTDFGLPEEAQILAGALARGVKVPILAVLGNHDYEAGKPDDVRRILVDAGVVVLDGEAHEVEGVGFVGVKGFAGGFGRRTLEPWGEPGMKAFVREALEETLKLESALAKLRTERRVALLHYAPIEATVEGEPREIYPFLGSSRLEEPLNRYEVDLAFHGHAHRGALEGRTSAGVPVYNVAAPLLRRTWPDRPPFRVITLAMDQAVPANGAPARDPAAPAERTP